MYLILSLKNKKAGQYTVDIGQAMGIQTVKEVENLGRALEHVDTANRETAPPPTTAYEHLLNTQGDRKNKSYP